jgi:uncharacterized RDD family membrane protein YckC
MGRHFARRARPSEGQNAAGARVTFLYHARMTDFVDAQRYRTFWRRFWAGLIDGVVLSPVSWVDQLIWETATSVFILLPWWVFSSCSYIAYSVLLHGYRGQTIGKQLMRVKVYDVSGAKLSLKQAALRDSVVIAVMAYGIATDLPWVLAGTYPYSPERQFDLALYIALYAMFGWYLLELITMLLNPKRRAIHDFIAGSVVMRTS